MKEYELTEIKFFIVEDDAVFINILSDVINSVQKNFVADNVKFSTKTFYSVKEARFELRQKPDIILLDYYITDDTLKPATSDKLLEDIKTSGEDVKVIVISGEDDPDIIDDLKKKGAAFYISKNPKTLQRIIPVLKMTVTSILEKRRKNR